MNFHRRNCFLPNEKKLSLYKVYNKATCMAECKSNFIEAKCGCVPDFVVGKFDLK